MQKRESLLKWPSAAFNLVYEVGFTQKFKTAKQGYWSLSKTQTGVHCVVQRVH